MTINCKKKIKGTYFPPGDKSISHRILILTGQAVGESQISNLLEGEDVLNTLKSLRLLGVKISFKKNYCEVIGNGGEFWNRNKTLIGSYLFK